jgi:hypothetical protein
MPDQRRGYTSQRQRGWSFRRILLQYGNAHRLLRKILGDPQHKGSGLLGTMTPGQIQAVGNRQPLVEGAQDEPSAEQVGL